MPLRFAYVSRHLNHSGYEVLQSLLTAGLIPHCVVLHDAIPPLARPFRRFVELFKYRFQCGYYKCSQLRTVRSEYLLAKKHGLKILLTSSMKCEKFQQSVRDMRLDILVLGGGWHELVPPAVFKAPRLGCINTHPSLLPEFRGTSITRWQVLNGVSLSGVSIHYVNDDFDAGGVIAQEELVVNSDETPQELFLNLSKLAASMMPRVLLDISKHDLLPATHRECNPEFTKYYRRWQWKQSDKALDLNLSLREIHFIVKANTQECFCYGGPLIKINGVDYYLRSTQLSSAVDQVVESRSGVSLEWEEGDLFLNRSGEAHRLRIITLQHAPSAKWFRRAGVPEGLFRPGEKLVLTDYE